MFDPLLDLLKQNGYLDDDTIAIIEEEQKSSGKSVRQTVIDGEYCTEDDLLSMMAAYQGCDVIDLANMTLETDTVNAIPASIARMYNVLCVDAARKNSRYFHPISVPLVKTGKIISLTSDIASRRSARVSGSPPATRAKFTPRDAASVKMAFHCSGRRVSFAGAPTSAAIPFERA